LTLAFLGFVCYNKNRFSIFLKKEDKAMLQTKTSWQDLIAVAVVAIVAVLLLLFPLLNARQGGTLVIVTPDGSKEYSLGQEQTILVESNGITLEIVIENGEAYVLKSDCPDGICTSSGRISVRGDTVICAPAGVKLYVKGGEGDIDHVAG
jgi:hypothetical protein